MNRQRLIFFDWRFGFQKVPFLADLGEFGVPFFWDIYMNDIWESKQVDEFPLKKNRLPNLGLKYPGTVLFGSCWILLIFTSSLRFEHLFFENPTIGEKNANRPCNAP